MVITEQTVNDIVINVWWSNWILNTLYYVELAVKRVVNWQNGRREHSDEATLHTASLLIVFIFTFPVQRFYCWAWRKTLRRRWRLVTIRRTRKMIWTGGKPRFSIRFIQDHSRMATAMGWEISKVRNCNIIIIRIAVWSSVTISKILPNSILARSCVSSGIEEKAEHFKDIGVDCVWLSPIFKSPMADFGYDISDYNQIDSTFGTMDDFISLHRKLKSLGNIIINIVVYFAIMPT